MNPVKTETVNGGTLLYFDCYTDCSEGVKRSQSSVHLLGVGHTDSTGTVEGNLKLSQDRAQAVMQSLVKDHGIAASRLRSAGCGQYAPVATNDTEEGRAKNRRVELVKQ